MLRAGLKRVKLMPAVNQQSVRNVTQGVCYPRNRMPFIEKVFHGVAIFLGALAGPTYIALNFDNYTGRSKQ